MQRIFNSIAWMMGVLVMLSSCQSFPDTGIFGSEPQTWDFIQSVGGMALGDPYERDGFTWIPLLVDLSGNRAITTSPTNVNTGLACAQLRMKRSRNRISLVLYAIDAATLPAGFAASQACAAIPLRRASSLWELMPQSIYYGGGGNRELLGVVGL